MILCAQCANWGGGWSHGWRGGVLLFMYKVNLARDLMFQTDSWFPIPGPIMAPCPEGGWGVELCGSYSPIAIWPFIQPRMCEMGLPLFDAMVQINCAITTRASLPSMPPIEITNG